MAPKQQPQRTQVPREARKRQYSNRGVQILLSWKNAEKAKISQQGAVWWELLQMCLGSLPPFLLRLALSSKGQVESVRKSV